MEEKVVTCWYGWKEGEKERTAGSKVERWLQRRMNEKIKMGEQLIGSMEEKTKKKEKSMIAWMDGWGRWMAG